MVLAHEVGSLGGLPLERWQFAWGVAALVVIAFFAANAGGRPAPAPGGGRPFPGGAQAALRILGVVARVVGLAAYVLVVSAGLFGSEFPAVNPAPIGVLVTFWVGVAVLSIVVGDVWRVLSPFETLALVAAWARARLQGRPLAPAEEPEGATHWPAAVVVGAFVWFELAYHSPTSPRILGLLGLGYGVVVLAVAAVRGRGWLRTGEGFAVLFGLLAAISPFGRLDDGRVGVRSPRRSLAAVEARPGTLVLLFVVLGGAVFDGFAATRFWFDLVFERVGWGLTVVDTMGLAWAVGIVALVHLCVTRVVAWVGGTEPDPTARRYAAVLVPVVAAYLVAHHVSALVVEGQGFWFLISDPYAEGWDLFGTAGGVLDVDLVSATAIAWIQAAAISLGHVLGVVVAHDRAVTDLAPRKALLAQYALLAMLVGSSVAAVSLLLGS